MDEKPYIYIFNLIRKCNSFLSIMVRKFIYKIKTNL
jgi:hypothetical protein